MRHNLVEDCDVNCGLKCFLCGVNKWRRQRIKRLESENATLRKQLEAAQGKKDTTSYRDYLFELITEERGRQDEKWGFPQFNTFCEWGSIIAEEVGELCQELNENNFGRGDRSRIIEEAVQVAAVAISLLEHYNAAEYITTVLAYHRRGEHKPGPLENGGAMRNVDGKSCKTGDLGTSGEQEGAEG